MNLINLSNITNINLNFALLLDAVIVEVQYIIGLKKECGFLT
jgi:hypothetical protein